MRTEFLITRLAVVAALFLVMATMVACNDHDDASDGEAVVEVTSTTLTGLDPNTAGDVYATLTLKLQDRSGIASSFFNDVLFTSYSASFTSDGVAPVPLGVNGVITSNACPIGGTCELVIFLVADGDRGGAGTAQFAIVQVRGMDLNGNSVTFTHQIAIAYGSTIILPGTCDTSTGLCTSPASTVGNTCTVDSDCDGP